MFGLRPFLICFLLLAAQVPAPPAVAQGTNVAFGATRSDPTQPVEVTADTLDVNQQTGAAQFEGNVLIAQGEMKLSADQVLVIYSSDRGGIERLEAVGNVVLVSGPDAAEAERADYSVDTGTIVMTGSVLLTQGPNVISSERMTVNLTDGTANMAGRVRTILNQGND